MGLLGTGSRSLTPGSESVSLTFCRVERASALRLPASLRLHPTVHERSRPRQAGSARLSLRGAMARRLRQPRARALVLCRAASVGRPRQPPSRSTSCLLSRSTPTMRWACRDAMPRQRGVRACSPAARSASSSTVVLSPLREASPSCGSRSGLRRAPRRHARRFCTSTAVGALIITGGGASPLPPRLLVSSSALPSEGTSPSRG